MIYCKKCGSELRGAKNFCMVCGTEQTKVSKDSKPSKPVTTKKKTSDKAVESGSCQKCGENTDKQCYFCKTFVCREHYLRMQPNVIPSYDMIELKNQMETRRINEGWRGFIISSCSKCSGIMVGKHLTDEENEDMNTITPCSWYKLDS
jgi:hypothetical protein